GRKGHRPPRLRARRAMCRSSGRLTPEDRPVVDRSTFRVSPGRVRRRKPAAPPGATLVFRAMTEPSPRPFFIDTDTASDDAVALAMALRHPDVHVVGIGVVAGNVPLDMALQNALYTRELCGRPDVPVYAGAAAPLSIPLDTAQ